MKKTFEKSKDLIVSVGASKTGQIFVAGVALYALKMIAGAKRHYDKKEIERQEALLLNATFIGTETLRCVQRLIDRHHTCVVEQFAAV